MKIITACQLSNYRPRKDKSLGLSFITGEKTPRQVMEIHSMLDVFGYMLFKGEETLTKDEIAELDQLDTDLYDNPKTKSQRFRGVLYRNWQNENQGYEEFKDYYDFEYEKIINHYKNKLPDRD